MAENEKLKSMQVVKASAGSGKTYELSYQYIKYLIGEKQKETGNYVLRKSSRDAHRSILAVTFTNKATEEMKTRFLDELEKLVKYQPGQSEGTYMERLCEEFGGASHEAVQSAAKKALEEILFFYSTFNVGTIDSFFQSILRTFAFDAGLDSNFQLEIKEEYLLMIAIHNFLMKLGMGDYSGTMVEKWVLDLVHENIENETGRWNFFQQAMMEKDNALLEIAKKLHSETARKYIVEIKNYFKDLLEDLSVTKSEKEKQNANIILFLTKLNKKIKVIEESVTNIKTDFGNLIISTGHTIDDISSKAGVTFFKKLCNDEKITEINADYLDAVINYSDDKIGALFSAKNDKYWKKECEKGEHNDVAQKIRELASKAKKVRDALVLLKGIKKDIYNFGLLGVILMEYERIKKDENIFVLSDTNTLINGIVGGTDLSFIYERTGTRIDNYLIDEFQDTSKLQYENFRPLLKESVSHNNDNLIIGDVKQSIYRFRNSDPSLLQTHLAEDFNDVINIDDTNVTNWRSKPEVIKFNNTFFKAFAKNLKQEDVYSHLVQKVSPKNSKKAGYVNITLLKKEKDEKYKSNVFERLPHLITDILNRGYKQSDIAILVSKNTEGSDVVDCLLEYNRNQDAEEKTIKVISSESLLLKNSVAVRLIIGHLRYMSILNYKGAKTEKERKLQEQREQIFRVLLDYEATLSKPENKGVAKGDLLAQCFANDDEKKKKQSVEQYNEHVQNMRPHGSDTFSLISIVENVIRMSIKDDLLREECAFIYAFQDFVSSFCSTNKNATISAFLRYWENKSEKLSISSPADAKAVNVMTIHKSKGLEFPIVIIPFATWTIGVDPKHKKNYWVTREELKEQTIFDDFDENIIPPVLNLAEGAVEAIKKNEITQAHSDMVVDSLNKTYVAFTRAKDELYVFAQQQDTSKCSDDLAEKGLDYALTGLLPKLTEEFADNVDKEFAEKTGIECEKVGIAVRVKNSEIEDEKIAAVYEVGDPTHKDIEDKKDAAPEFEPMPIYSSRENVVKLSISKTYNKRQEDGNRLHAFLSQIRRAKDCERALHNSQMCGMIDETLIDKANELIDKIKNDKQISLWFADDNEVFNERRIYLPQEKETERNWRLDRIVRRPNGDIIVIDYKFAVENKSHIAQVQHYCDLISQAISKRGKIEGYLWYPLENKIKKVEFDG